MLFLVALKDYLLEHCLIEFVIKFAKWQLNDLVLFDEAQQRFR